MIRILLPFILAALAYGYWKFLASVPADVRQKRLKVLAMWAVFAVTLVAAVRTGSATWLIATAVVMVVMRYLARLGRERREQANRPHGASSDASPRPPSMSRAEALQIFELGGNPNKDAIQKRYRELMRTVHPDHGGSNYLTAKLNEAYGVLMAGESQ